MTVRFCHNNKMKLCDIIDVDDPIEDKEQGFKSIVLNSEESHTVPSHMVAPIYGPDPSDA